MFWLSLILLGLAAALLKLGALSAWMSILSLALKASLVVIAVLGAALIWKYALKARCK